jgi:glycosyltransferase involved in cell wall biosynthesis
MKAAMLIPSISRRAGGLRDCVLNLSRSLKSKHDIDVDIFSVDDEFAQVDRQLWSSLSVHLAPPKLAAFRYAPDLAQQISSLKPDLLHTHGLWTYLSIVESRWAKSGHGKRPYIVSAHGMLDPWALRNSQWKKRLALMLFERGHLERATCLHAVNQAEAAAMRDFGLTNPICVIANGVEIPDSGQASQQPPWNSELVDGRKVLLYLGRLHPKKGLPLLLRAWGDTSAAKANWMLKIAGWDQVGHLAQLQKMVSDLHISDSVEFLGSLFDERRTAAYHHADAFVLPSLSEGLPMAVLEAWSYAKPVLMTPECNLPEGFAAGAALRIGAHENEIAAGLRQLFEMNENDRVAVGARGRALVAEKFSWPKIGQQMRKVYQWVLGGGAPPDTIGTK